MLSPYHQISVHAIGKSSQEFRLSAVCKLRQEQIKHPACCQNFQNLQPDQIEQHMCRSQHHADEVQKDQGRVKKTQGKHIGSHSIGEIPQGKIPRPQMVHNRSIMHGILLPGISPYIIKHQHRIPEQITSKNKKAADKQSCQKQQPCLRFFI